MPNPMATTSRKTVRIHCAVKLSSIPQRVLRHVLSGSARKLQQAYLAVRVCARGNMLKCRDVQAAREPVVALRASTRRSHDGTGSTQEGQAPDAPAAGFPPPLPALRTAQAVLEVVHASRPLPVVRAELQP